MARKDSGGAGDSDGGRFAYDGLDRVIHEKARLGLMTSLAASSDGVTFVELKELCRLTDGNLSRHLKVLEDAGLVGLWKRGAGRNQQTLVQLTATGRAEFLKYLGVLEQVVRDAGVSAQGFRERVSPA
ncbi:Helix-turn-helix domain protein [Caulifigura coniformis]|uniref:Helix-turn-helix domain protein n=1 Tax=Caulifigura coniformis TaxID=2527983 RepID=A0A517SEW6_9PLAN|nr:transcriptional regulator [Caulifigura coniformis]QDT54679.1 Helix-turn-helix domain protein [Caulifigura coniformis]